LWCDEEKKIKSLLEPINGPQKREPNTGISAVPKATVQIRESSIQHTNGLQIIPEEMKYVINRWTNKFA
jgi:hypothetical protein